MKRIILLHCFFLATLLTATAQISFNERYKTTVRGDMIVVGNNIIGPTKQVIIMEEEIIIVLFKYM